MKAMPTTSVPTRWRGERLAHPPKRFRRLARLLDIQIREDDPDVLRLRDGLMQGDPVADAYVEWATRNPKLGRVLFERAVEGGLAAVPDAPEPLVRWFEPLERPPAWLDRDALRLGCRTAWRCGPSGGVILSAMALMGGYRSSAAVKPLAMTGALDKMVVRRIAETSRFVLDVFESETLDRFSAGFESACRVRLMHAMVRRALARRDDWDTEAWGVPINQADTAATQLEFSAIYLSGLTLLGFRFTKEERDAVMHLWRYVGVVMGADDAILAHDYRAGLRQMFIHGLTNPHADEDSRALAKALHELPVRFARNLREKLLAQIETRYRTAVSRFTLGDEAADDIGLPQARWYPALAPLAAGRFAVETLRRRIPGATAFAEKRGLELQRQIIHELVGQEKVRYIPYGDRRSESTTASSRPHHAA